MANAGDKQFLGNQEAFSGDYFVVHGTQDPCVDSTGKAFTVGRNQGGENVVCVDGGVIGRKPENGGNGIGCSDAGVCYTLTATDRHAVTDNYRVRRLTPVECERLQGFPDDYTRIAWRNKKLESCPDGPRYKAIGNSMAVPVMRWIGQRIVADIGQPTTGASGLFQFVHDAPDKRPALF